MKHRKQSDGSGQAFALTELLVVVAVIAILAGLALSGVARAKQQAQSAKCRSNLHQLGLALTGFVSEHHVYPMHANPESSPYPEHQRTWIHALEREGMGSTRTNFSDLLTAGVWHCPAAKWSENFPTNAVPASYAYNVYGLFSPGKPGSLGLGGHRAPGGGFTRPVRESEVTTPRDMMALGESFSGGVVFMRQEILGNDGRRAATRHQAKANVLFTDGHIGSPTLKFLHQDRSDAALVKWSRDHQPHRELLPN